MAKFATPTDIVNRGRQGLGLGDIAGTDSLAAPTTSATTEFAGAYDKLRLAELQRNVWTFACRRTTIRPMSMTTVVFTPPTYAAGTIYFAGDVVIDASGAVWVSKQNANIGNTPGVVPATGVLFWDTYFGNLYIDAWNASAVNTTTNTAYDAGEVVYKTPGDGTYAVYRSLVSSNSEQPDAVDAYVSTTMYAAGAVVSVSGVNYQSLVALNVNHAPPTSPTQWTGTVTNALVSGSWRQVIGAMIAPPTLSWPLASGPSEDIGTRNVYPLPAGFLKEAPQKPKAGVMPYLGASRALPQDDWEKTGAFFVTSQTGPVAYRFVADVQDVTTMDAMFCEGLGLRMGHDLCERVTQAPEKKASLAQDYAQVMGDARTVNAIEQGPVEAPLERYVAVRQ